MRRLLAPALAALALIGLSAGPAPAQDNYPNRPVKIMIAFPVGGLLDTVSRIVGEKMTRPARPAVHHRGAARRRRHARHAARRQGRARRLHGDDAQRQPRAQSVGVQEHSLRQHQGLLADRLRRLHAAGVCRAPERAGQERQGARRARQEESGAITYGSVGVGSASHLAGEMLDGAADVKLQHVPYRGGAPGHDRSAGRPRQHDVPEPGDRPAEHQERQADRRWRSRPTPARNPARTCRP